ncbi:hypothetical protein [Nocardia higoensis]|uniref:hypothetical protein n=1 Tax=Nocardia higoensis TaxID=228599 RepID=UPI0012F62C61|nr:hypothetical protein [Nocardia higoensis]
MALVLLASAVLPLARFPAAAPVDTTPSDKRQVTRDYPVDGAGSKTFQAELDI